MKYLGLDLSLNSVGWCIIIVKKRKPKVFRYGLIKPRKLRGMDRLLNVESKIRKIWNTWKIDGVGLEGHSKGSNPRFGLHFDRIELAGIIKRFFFIRNMGIHIFAPKNLKKVITGNGNADKELVIDAVKGIAKIGFNKIPKGGLDDVADAFSVAYMALAKDGYISIPGWRKEILKG
jgi:crossover junction endodeoxyribonuclease RuvC